MFGWSVEPGRPKPKGFGYVKTLFESSIRDQKQEMLLRPSAVVAKSATAQNAVKRHLNCSKRVF
jgi:hypothetical protein